MYIALMFQLCFMQDSTSLAEAIKLTEQRSAVEQVGDPVRVNLGDLQAGQRYQLPMRLKNNLGLAFRPVSVRSSCGCTIGVIPNRVVEPGAEMPIVIRVIAKKSGGFLQRMAVYCEMADQTYTLNLLGSVSKRLSRVF